MEREVSMLDVEEGPPILDAQVRLALVAPGLVNVEPVAATQIALATELVAAGRTLVADGEDHSCAGVPLDGDDGGGDGSQVDWVCDSYPWPPTTGGS
jgi:hypothetical protein